MIKSGSLLYVSMVAQMLCCSPKHVYNLIHRGDLEAVRIGRRAGYRVVRASVVKYLEENNFNHLEV